MAVERPRICAAITVNDIEMINHLEPQVDLWEVRIDLIGKGWRKVAAQLKKPWIACNRHVDEGGKGDKKETARVKELLSALELGAHMIDIELATAGLADIVKEIKTKARCLVSYHNLKETPPLDRLRQIIINELAAEADICKLVTTAKSFEDNISILQVIKEFPENKLVAFAMGKFGQLSRVLGPLAGGSFTYASFGEGKESAEGQVTVGQLRKIYGMLGNE